jgi:2-phosphosulfolactate phosphatase
MRIDVALTPAERPAPAAVAVVIDVLRATTTIVAALEAGYARVLACRDLEQAREWALSAGDGAVLAGERACVRPPGFRLGNSPSELSGAPLGESLVLSTTNGTRAILAAAEAAPAVVIGCLWNLEACAREASRLADSAAGGVLVQCAGVRGSFALDDAYVAGRLVAELRRQRVSAEPTDTALAACAIAAGFDSPLAALRASQSARELVAVGLDDDIAVCAKELRLAVVPRASASAGSAALVGLASNPAADGR